jgi:hypothetical protein
MSDQFGLNKAARREAENALKDAELRIPVALNPALPGKRVAFDLKFFSVEAALPRVKEKEGS